MDYSFPFGRKEKIYCVDEVGLSLCKKNNSGSSVSTTSTIQWTNILSAGECVMTSPAYQASRQVGHVIAEVLPHGRNPQGFQEMLASVERMDSFVIVAYTKPTDGKKKLKTFVLNTGDPMRQAFLADLSAHLGDRWLGEAQDPTDLKKRIGVPRAYQIRGVIVLVILVATVALLLYVSYFMKR